MAFIEDRQVATALCRARIPSIELFAHRLDLRIPQPIVFLCRDDDASGLAAWEENQTRIRIWLRGLEKLVGVMAASDRLALRILDACRAERFMVPEEIAVVGVDNDEETCRLANPPLSSVMDDARRIGWIAEPFSP